MQTIYKLGRILFAILVAIIPVIWGDKLHSLDKGYLAVFAVCAGLLAVCEILYDRQVVKEADARFSRSAAELGQMRTRLEYAKGRGLSMARLIELVVPIDQLIRELTKGVPDLKKEGNAKEAAELVSEGLDKLHTAMQHSLNAASEEVRGYMNGKENSVNSCLMLGYHISDLSAPEVDRLRANAQFLVYQRKLETYKHALELVVWGRHEPAIPHLVLPVEDGDTDGGKRRLIPGAPEAFALGKDTVISDTWEISSNCPELLDGDVQDRLLQYFRTQPFRSFASLVISERGVPKGVLNIQWSETNIFGPNGADKETMAKTLEHYRQCLQYLTTGHLTLQRLAS